MTHVTRVLCAVDFSEAARHALDHAVALARFWNASLAVLYVYQHPAPQLVGPYLVAGAEAPASLTDAGRRETLDALNDFIAAHCAQGVHIDTLIEEAFVVPRAVIDCAVAEHADLLVLGTHGRSGFERLALGSVAERVLRTSPIPVLTVPPRAAGTDPRMPLSIERIVCPIDFGPSSLKALDQAVSLAERAQARLTVAHIVDLADEAPEPIRAEFVDFRRRRFDEGRRQLREIVPESMRRRCAVSELVLVGKPYREIVRLAEEQQADLIVMGVRGRGAADLLLFGSTANQVVRQARCPVLTVRG